MVKSLHFDGSVTGAHSPTPCLPHEPSHTRTHTRLVCVNEVVEGVVCVCECMLCACVSAVGLRYTPVERAVALNRSRDHASAVAKEGSSY